MSLPVSPNDPVNARILSVAEDRVEGFRFRPFDAVAEASGVGAGVVLARLRAMLEAGVVRRVRQTLQTARLARGALVAWRLPEERLRAAWLWLKRNDPFTGHIVIRRAEGRVPGEEYRLWTTLKVPAGCNTPEGHCRLVSRFIGAESWALLPAKGVFVLGVGHVRRRGLRPGDRLPRPAGMRTLRPLVLSPGEWRVLLALKEPLAPGEMVPEPWSGRAGRLGLSPGEFRRAAEELDGKGALGRFAVFLEHVRVRSADGPVTGYNGLFHWTVPRGMEERAGGECGRHLCMTHCYWRTGAGSLFGGAQIMGVVHGSCREEVFAHKAAIDAHLARCGVPVLHTAVFRSELSEVRPSELSPDVYRSWLAGVSGGALRSSS